MKNSFVYRSLSFIVVFLFILAMMPTFAETSTEVDFDVSDYTDEELLEIMYKIQQTDAKIGYLYSSDALVVGKDIPAGQYEFWIEEEDIAFTQEFIDKPYDYHCGASTLCYVIWGSEKKEYSFENYVEFFYDEYGIHKLVALEEGQILWTKDSSAGTSYVGIRMKYFPNRKSGLF